MMMKIPTEFAPAERMAVPILERQFAALKQAPQLEPLLDSLPAMVLLLNPQRQIIFANQAYQNKVGTANSCSGNDPALPLLGLRPGESANCIHAQRSPGGCGTSVFCQNCGAVKVILNSQQTGADMQECRLLRQTAPGITEALDLRATAKSLAINGNTFTVLTLEDISDEKRRLALERIYFHDLLNCAGNIQGLVMLLSELDLADPQIQEIAKLLNVSSAQMVDEIKAQRTITIAEQNELQVAMAPLSLLPFMRQLAQTFSAHEAAQGKHIRIHPAAKDRTVDTDATLLRRVLVNLLKNALEASTSGQTVTFNLTETGGNSRISVHNPAVMPPNIRNQVFNRSFSTHGKGRGQGTFCVKLLTERYLGGSVECESSAETGTIFTVQLPLNQAGTSDQSAFKLPGDRA